MIIKESNREGLQTMLDDAQGKATHRTVEVDGLMRIADYATEQVQARTFLPKSEQAGARVMYHMEIKLPSSYRYRPYYTIVCLTRRSGGWALEHAFRSGGNKKQKERLSITLNIDQADESRRRLHSQFRVE